MLQNPRTQKKSEMETPTKILDTCSKAKLGLSVIQRESTGLDYLDLYERTQKKSEQNLGLDTCSQTKLGLSVIERGLDYLDLYERTQKKSEQNLGLDTCSQTKLGLSVIERGLDYLDLYERTRKKSEQNLGSDTCSTKLSLPVIERESTGSFERLDLNERDYSNYSASLRLSVYEEYFGLCWLSACYPLDPRLIYEDQEQKYRTLAYLAEPLLESAIPEHLAKLALADDDDDIKESGESLNVSSFLCDGDRLVRHDGEQIVLDMDTFRGKYVLVCCFNVPVLWGTYGSQSLLNLCHELVSHIDNFEMVMVARMNTLADSETVFSNFFKAFPSSCLAVPYEESERRDHICKLLNLGVVLKLRFYDIDGTVIPSVVGSTQCAGAEAFPFTREVMIQTAAQHQKLRKSSLDQLLRLDSPPVVYKFNPAGGLQEEVFISNLIYNKYVGLYMCTEGSLIPILHKLFEQCRSKRQEFEIVVLYCPFSEVLDSKFFKAKIDRLLQEQNVRGWWCLPFNNSVSLRFECFTSNYMNGSVQTTLAVDCNDKLIIVGPDGNITDMYGAEVIRYHGIDAYPFTREARVKEEEKKVRKITLESILVTDVYQGFDRRNTISASELVSSKKKVIVYMTVSHDNDSDTWLHQKLVTEYQELKQNRGTEFEMVFINNSYEDPESNELEEIYAQCIKEMPWFVYPHNGKRTSSLKDLRKLVRDDALVGFGEDGHLCSFESPFTLDAVLYCLSDTLYQDIYRQFGYAFCSKIL